MAATHYRALAASAEHRRRALVLLALLAPETINEDELADLRRAAWDAAADQESQISALFALGPVLEGLGDYDSGFEAFRQGNRLKRAALGDQAIAAARAHERSVALQRARFTPALLASRDPAASASKAPIFIVGFPRSGSSLVEQILASHRDVQGMGETGLLSDILDRGGSSAAYLAAIRSLGWKARPHFTDKTLENYLHVGSIHRMFPRAIVIHTVRDPTDTGFACWRQLFASGGETLYDLAEIGAEHRRYQAMMEHWRTVLPGRVVDVTLESLVAAPEPAIRDLVRVCGLSWDPACARFWRTSGPVRTASAAQVRRPISAGGPGRWRRYEDRLGALRSALLEDPSRDVGGSEGR